MTNKCICLTPTEFEMAKKLSWYRPWHFGTKEAYFEAIQEWWLKNEKTILEILKLYENS